MGLKLIGVKQRERKEWGQIIQNLLIIMIIMIIIIIIIIIMMFSYVERLICGNIPFSVQIEEVVEITNKQYPNKRNFRIK